MLSFEETMRVREDFQSLLTGAPSGQDLKKMADILRKSGYKVVNKNKRKRY